MIEKQIVKKYMKEYLMQEYIKSHLPLGSYSKIDLRKTPLGEKIIIHTSRPGVVIGKSGKEITQLEQELKEVTDKDVKVQINEIKRPELDAYLVAENIANQIEGRVSFRRAMKMAITAAMRMGAEGIRIMCAGRLGGAEMARTEQYKEGRIPLHTLRADIDYASGRAETIYGSVGIKVWVCRGEILGKRVSE